MSRQTEASTARRRIGDAVVEIAFTGRVVEGRWVYRGRVVVPAAASGGRRVVWRSDHLQTGVGGVPDGRGGKHAPRSPEALDEMAQAAVSFGAYFSPDHPRDPDERTAAAIEAATGWALRDDGSYEVARTAETRPAGAEGRRT